MTTLRYGSYGDDVKTLQKALGGLTVDGIFGKATLSKVKQYQTSRGLEADGIVGPITWAALTGTSVTDIKVVDYKQYDSRWGGIKYSTHTAKQTIRNSGCGPTAMANIVATFFDPSVTPKTLCALSVKNGFRTYNSGTDWDFFEFVSKRYEFSAFRQKGNDGLDIVIAALNDGALVVASMGPGYWTQGGHFITLTRCKDGNMYANDPASSTRKYQKLSKFKRQAKQYFIFWPPIGWGDAPDEPEAPITPIVPTEDPVEEIKPSVYVPGTGIYDVSKWQGKIDWDVAAATGKIGLMILRAGFGQETTDARFERNVKACIRLGIPFGVYWYSYATSVDRMRNEIHSFYAQTKEYKPLFWCIDCEEGSLNAAMINAGTRLLRELGAHKIVNYIANHRFKVYACDTTLPDAIWIPLYIKDRPPAHRPCDLWQYGGERVKGIGTSAIDANRIPKSGRFSLEWFLGKNEADETAPEGE